MKTDKKAAPSGSRSKKIPLDVSADPLLAALQAQTADFRDRGVVVTGGASGIGRAIAVAFALAGARVIVIDMDSKLGAKTLRLLREISPDARFILTDLRDPAAVARAAKVFRGPKGADILINNAATVGQLAPMHEVKQEIWEGVIRANLLAPMQLSQAAAQHLIANKRTGTIINVLTIQTELPVPNYTAYAASKGGMDALTIALAVDLGPFGIRVNGIRVGSVLTENYLSVLPPALKQKVAEGMDPARLLDERAATLLNRMGRPADIAKVALFLASEEANFITGSIIRADGGRAISRKIEPLL